MYDIVRTVDATVEPVTLQQAKAHCRVDIDDDDDLLSMYITAARQFCEQVTGRAFLMQTWRLSLEHFPFYGFQRTPMPGQQPYRWYGIANWWRPEILLPRPNLIAVESITYLDQTGTQQTLDPSAYIVLADALPARLLPAVNTIWPFALWQRGSVQITYTAGYGSDPGAVPATLKMAILQLVGHWYENRESTVLPATRTGVVAVPMAVAELLEAETFTAFTLES